MQHPSNRAATGPLDASGGGLTYHLLVALIFAACLPLVLARAVGAAGGIVDGADATTLAAAIDAARTAAARAFSLPG